MSMRVLFSENAIEVLMLSINEESQIGSYVDAVRLPLAVKEIINRNAEEERLNSEGIDRVRNSMNLASDEIRFEKTKEIVELSLLIADQRGHDYVGPEHLLLGLLQALRYDDLREATRMVNEINGEGGIANRMPNFGRYGTDELALKIEEMLEELVEFQQNGEENPPQIHEAGIGNNAIAEDEGDESADTP